MGRSEQAEILARAVCSNDLAHARVLPAAGPGLAREDFYLACACGEVIPGEYAGIVEYLLAQGVEPAKSLRGSAPVREVLGRHGDFPGGEGQNPA